MGDPALAAVLHGPDHPPYLNSVPNLNEITRFIRDRAAFPFGGPRLSMGMPHGSIFRIAKGSGKAWSVGTSADREI
jgi:hypothetical protein